jgi:DNA-binding transcriptional MerR regulator
MKFLDIGEVSRAAGIAPSALRYYEEIGLIRPDGRHGLRRQYGPEVLTQLSLISLARAAGFSLEETGAMFGRDGKPDIPRDLLRERARETAQRARRLAALADLIDHVADCPAPSHLDCPTFRRLLALATQHQQAQRARTARKPRA